MQGIDDSRPRDKDARRPLAIALLSPCFWPEVRRGGERLVQELANGLIARGHRPRLITSHPGWPSTSVEDGLPIVRHWRPPDDRLRRRHYEDHLTHVPFSYLSLRRGSDDLAHAFYVTDALAAAFWSRRTRRPSVLTYLGIPDRSGLVERRRRLGLTARAMRGCSAVVTVSRAAADACRRSLGVESHVVYPGIDLERFSPGGSRSEAPTIFCAAAVDQAHKRLDLLLDAYRLVRRKRADVKLILLRPSPETQERIRSSEPSIEFVDPVASDLAPFYRRAWISVLPSVGEAFGLVLAEALACGTPVVGSRHGGIPEVIDRPEVGRVFDPDDERGLSRAMLETLALAELPVTAAACTERAAEFSTERSTDEYERLYERLLSCA